MFSGLLQARSETFGKINNLPGISDVNHSHVSNMVQDDLGFLWFATWNGLVRYDGDRFYYFRPVLNSNGEIDSNRLYNLKQLGSRYIWNASSDNKLLIYDRQENIFINLTSSIPEISDKLVQNITPLKNGTVKVLFRDQSSMSFRDSDPLSGYTLTPSPENFIKGSKKIRKFQLSGDDEWVITDKGARDLSNGTICKGNFTSVENVGGYSLLVTSDGAIVDPPSGMAVSVPTGNFAGQTITGIRVVGSSVVLGSERGVESVAMPTRERVSYSTRPSNYIYKDLKSRVWSFGDGDEVVMIPDVRKASSVEIPLETVAERDVMKNPQLIHETPEGTIILKTPGSALSFYDETTAQIRPLRFYRGGKLTTFAPKHIKKFLSDSHGNLWLIHDDGTDCISFHTKQFHLIPNLSKNDTRSLLLDGNGKIWKSDASGMLYGGPSPLATGTAYCLEESPDGYIWAGTKGNGVWCIPGGNHGGSPVRFSRESAPPFYIPSDSIYDIAFDSPDRMWLASYGGGLIVGERTSGGNGNSPGGGVWNFRKIPVPASALKVRRVIPLSRSRLLLATTDGLVVADLTDASTPRFYVNRFRKDEEGLKGNDIMDVVKVGDRYFACVFGSGLSEIISTDLFSDSLSFRHYPMTAGADSDQIRAAVNDGKNIWVMSAASISCFNTATGTFTTYSSDSFVDEVGFSEATPIIVDGHIIAGTSEGIVEFAPDELTNSESLKPMVVSGIRFQNDSDILALDNPSLIEIEPHQRSFSLSLSTMEFDDSHMVNIRYYLDNGDEGWSYVRDIHPMVNFSKILPGTHKLVIERRKADGTWVEACPPITIKVHPRFTETVFFKIIIILAVLFLILGLVYAVIHFRRLHKAVQRKYSLLMTLDDINSHIDVKAEDIPQALSVEEADRKFLEDTSRVMERNLSNPDFVVEDLARELGMSRTAFFTKMKAITGLSPVNYIKQSRIKHALSLLENESLSVSEVAYRVGFEDPKYFSKCFKSEVSMTPTQWIDSRNDTQATEAQHPSVDEKQPSATDSASPQSDPQPQASSAEEVAPLADNNI